MIQKLRRKMVLINMTLVCTVLLVAILAIGYSSVKVTAQELYRSLRYQSELVLQEVSANEESHTEDEQPAKVPCVVARLSDELIWEILHDDIVADTDALLHALVYIQSTDKAQEVLFNLRLAYVCVDSNRGSVIVLGDAAMVLASMQNSILVGSLALLGGSVLMLLIVLCLTNMALKPAEDFWNQQKQFIADASHELKTPLTVISANNNIISAHAHETVAQQSQWLRSTAEEIVQMQVLIDEMLTLARAESNQTTVLLQKTDVSELLEEELLFLEPVAYEKHVELISRIDKHIILDTDWSLLKKITVILVDNAMKYGAAGKPVTVTLTDGKTVTLSVHNYGTPIAPDALPHLFDRFYRADRSRSSSGYGLGLPIANAIVQQLHGTLYVTSTEQDGTTFTAEFKK